VRTALSNVVWKALCLSVEKVSRLLLVIACAPILGQAAFGRFQLATTVTLLLGLVMDRGLGVWTTRTLARSRLGAGTLVVTVLRLRALAALPYVALSALAAIVVGPGDLRLTILLLGLAGLASAFVDHVVAVMRGYERLGDEARLNGGRALLVLVAGIGALWRWGTLAALAAGVAAGTLAAAAFGLWMLRRRYRLLTSVEPGAFDPALARAATREALPIWLAGLLSMLYFKGDTLILQALAGDSALGAYSAACKVFEGSMLIPAVLVAAIFPPLSRAHRDQERRGLWESRTFGVLLALGLLVSVVCYTAATPIVAALFGPRFEAAVPSLRILALGIPLLHVNYGLTHFLIARDLGHKNLVFAAWMLAINITLNLVAIPRLGGPGAAWATVLTEAALTVCCLATLSSRRAMAASSLSGPAATSKERRGE
jgi:O-antigen/teichoic acid export membrane protein